MTWTKNSAGWYVKEFPYFRLFIEISHTISGRPKYGFYTYGYFNTLDEAKIACIRHVRRELLRYQKEKKSIFSHNTWPSNTGSGKYVGLYKKRIYYNWLFAGYVPTAIHYKDHAIRLPIEWGDEQVLKFAKKIQDRHINRFLTSIGF